MGVCVCVHVHARVCVPVCLRVCTCVLVCVIVHMYMCTHRDIHTNNAYVLYNVFEIKVCFNQSVYYIDEKDELVSLTVNLISETLPSTDVTVAIDVYNGLSNGNGGMYVSVYQMVYYYVYDYL